MEKIIVVLLIIVFASLCYCNQCSINCQLDDCSINCPERSASFCQCLASGYAQCWCGPNSQKNDECVERSNNYFNKCSRYGDEIFCQKQSKMIFDSCINKNSTSGDACRCCVYDCSDRYPGVDKYCMDNNDTAKCPACNMWISNVGCVCVFDHLWIADNCEDCLSG